MQITRAEKDMEGFLWTDVEARLSKSVSLLFKSNELSRLLSL